MSFNYWQNFSEYEIYHIYNRSIDNLVLFKDHTDYRFFLRKYEQYFSPYFHTFAYCLIPNHFHLLVQVKSEKDIRACLDSENTKAAKNLMNGNGDINVFLEDQMRRFFSSVALSYNKKYDRRGPVFSEKTKRVSIQSEEKLIYLLSYIHHNPIHHKLSNTYEEWEFSSYKSYCSNLPTKIGREMILKELGGINVFLENHKSFKLDMGSIINIDI